MPPVRSGLVVVYDISPKALGPTRGLSAVLGRNALETPGDCGQARRALVDLEPNESQERCRSTRNYAYFDLYTHGTLSNLGGLFTERSLEVCDETGPHECLGDYAA